MEFTQPLGVGLGLVARINNQYSYPVCRGRRTDTYTTINDTQEISWYYWLLTRNVDTGIQEFMGTRYHVDDGQMTWTDESQMMASHGSHTSQSHKRIAQNKMMSCPKMEMMSDTFRCSRATQVCMEDLRLVNLTEICPSRRGECFKASC